MTSKVVISVAGGSWSVLSGPRFTMYTAKKRRRLKKEEEKNKTHKNRQFAGAGEDNLPLVQWWR